MGININVIKYQYLEHLLVVLLGDPGVGAGHLDHLDCLGGI